MAKRTENREYDQSEARPSTCRKCRSTRRTAYFGEPLSRIFEIPQVHPDGTEFTRLIRRRTKCQDCGQFRFDLSYEFVPEDMPKAASEMKPAAKKDASKKPPAPPQALPGFLGAATQG